MKTLFVDTFYWVALFNPKDEWHLTVINYSKNLIPKLIITNGFFRNIPIVMIL